MYPISGFFQYSVSGRIANLISGRILGAGYTGYIKYSKKIYDIFLTKKINDYKIDKKKIFNFEYLIYSVYPFPIIRPVGYPIAIYPYLFEKLKRVSIHFRILTPSGEQKWPNKKLGKLWLCCFYILSPSFSYFYSFSPGSVAPKYTLESWMKPIINAPKRNLQILRQNLMKV